MGGRGMGEERIGVKRIGAVGCAYLHTGFSAAGFLLRPRLYRPSRMQRTCHTAFIRAENWRERWLQAQAIKDKCHAIVGRWGGRWRPVEPVGSSRWGQVVNI